jgi:hypothetical protein
MPFIVEASTYDCIFFSDDAGLVVGVQTQKGCSVTAPVSQGSFPRGAVSRDVL